MALNAIVQIDAGAGAVRFGADLPLSVIAGPCQLESRAHALEVATALKEIAARLKIGLVFKTSFDKANRNLRGGRSRRRAQGGAADLRRDPRHPWPADADRRARAQPMRARRRSRRRFARFRPSFAVRPTCLVAAALTGRAVNVKKGQFLAPGT